ncbi:autotransporter outer membrane beta-barrel domain-containing protein, partial [bacterium]|nr:autotransporter outer membrane beta-barrel domain-containing protein [bacterium]
MAAQLGGYLTQLNSYDQAFMNLDMKMLLTREERQAMRMRNSYASTTTPQVFSPTYLPEEQKGGWVRPYASFEKVGLDGGPKVSNVMYGTFFGADSEMYELKNGAQAQFSVYAGYNGSHQAYNGNGIYQNGGTLGLTGIVYKDNFFTALTANAGASIADASTMYGSEDIPMMMAGVASKTGYNWELAKGKLIVQPNYLMSYSFVNTFNYTNAAGVKIESDPLNAIQIAPGVKFIGNLKNGWQPYVNLRMMWNLMDKTDFRAANTALPQLSVKPYFEYGVGLQKRWGERFTGFGQAMLRAGGRNGVALGFGFRWALGKAPSKAYTSNDSKNIVQPTTVKLSNIK